MNKQTFYTLIEHNESITDKVEDLQLLVEQFPYSSSLQLMYTKALKEIDSMHYSSQLHQCARVVSDRQKMFLYLHQEIVAKTIQEVEEVEESENNSELSVVKATTENNEVKEEVVEEVKSSEVENSEIETERSIEEVEVKTKEIKPIDELDKLIISEAISLSIHEEVDDAIEIIEESSETNLKNDIKTIVEEVNEPEEKVEDQRHSFMDWFQSSPQKENKQDVRKDSELVSLVDSFIQSHEDNKKEKTSEVAFYSPENSAKLSLVDSEEFVTETLANVYAKQGHFSKAIRIYEQLILKIPEKKTFFASRIRFLKEKQQYKND